MKSYRALLAFLILPALVAAPKKSSQPQNSADRIEVIGQVALAQGPTVNLLVGTHLRRNYIYVEHGTAGAVTVVDVTDPKLPKTMSEFVPPAGSVPLHMHAVEGSAALFFSTQAPGGGPEPSNLVLVSFVDQAHPQVVRQFAGVRCMLTDTSRGITYLASDDSLWVLQFVPAHDQDEMERYAHEVLYNH